jgi:hypothetical protein
MIGVVREAACVDVAVFRHHAFARAHGTSAMPWRETASTRVSLAARIETAAEHCPLCKALYSGVELALDLAPVDSYENKEGLARASDWMMWYRDYDHRGPERAALAAVAADVAYALADSGVHDWTQRALECAAAACHLDPTSARSLAYIAVETKRLTTQVNRIGDEAPIRSQLSHEIARRHESWVAVHRWISSFGEIEAHIRVNSTAGLSAEALTAFLDVVRASGIRELICDDAIPPCGLSEAELGEFVLGAAAIAMHAGHPTVAADLWAEVRGGDDAALETARLIAALRQDD